MLTLNIRHTASDLILAAIGNTIEIGDDRCRRETVASEISSASSLTGHLRLIREWQRRDDLFAARRTYSIRQPSQPQFASLWQWRSLL